MLCPSQVAASDTQPLAFTSAGMNVRACSVDKKKKQKKDTATAAAAQQDVFVGLYSGTTDDRSVYAELLACMTCYLTDI